MGPLRGSFANRLKRSQQASALFFGTLYVCGFQQLQPVRECFKDVTCNTSLFSKQGQQISTEPSWTILRADEGVDRKVSLSSLRGSEPISGGRKEDRPLTRRPLNYPSGTRPIRSDTPEPGPPHSIGLQVSALGRGILLNLRHFAERKSGCDRCAERGHSDCLEVKLKSNVAARRRNKRGF